MSVKRVFLNRGAAGARGSAKEVPRYHEKNVVAYPQDPDTIMQIVGLFPADLAKDLAIQFTGGDASGLRYEPTLTVSVNRLRSAFWWLA